MVDFLLVSKTPPCLWLYWYLLLVKQRPNSKPESFIGSPWVDCSIVTLSGEWDFLALNIYVIYYFHMLTLAGTEFIKKTQLMLMGRSSVWPSHPRLMGCFKLNQSWRRTTFSNHWTCMDGNEHSDLLVKVCSQPGRDIQSICNIVYMQRQPSTNPGPGRSPPA